jgi:hypothetical protein
MDETINNPPKTISDPRHLPRIRLVPYNHLNPFLKLQRSDQIISILSILPLPRSRVYLRTRLSGYYREKGRRLDREDLVMDLDGCWGDIDGRGIL